MLVISLRHHIFPPPLEMLFFSANLLDSPTGGLAALLRAESFSLSSLLNAVCLAVGRPLFFALILCWFISPVMQSDAFAFSTVSWFRIIGVDSSLPSIIISGSIYWLCDMVCGFIVEKTCSSCSSSSGLYGLKKEEFRVVTLSWRADVILFCRLSLLQNININH